MVKNSPANARDLRDEGSTPGQEDPLDKIPWTRSPGAGNGSPLQYSYLGNPKDREAWQATVHGVTKSQTRLKQLSTHDLGCRKMKQSDSYIKCGILTHWK